MAGKKKKTKTLHFVVERTFRYEVLAPSMGHAINKFLCALADGTIKLPVQYHTNIVCENTGDEETID